MSLSPTTLRDGVGTLAVAALVAGAVAALPMPDEWPEERRSAALTELRTWENQARSSTNFATLPPASRVTGANPSRIRALEDGGFVGYLRGRDAVIHLTRNLQPHPEPDATQVTIPQDWLASPGSRLSADAGGYRVVGSVLEHTVRIESADSVHRHSIQLDGPVWSVAALELGNDVWVAVGAVEDRPLDRAGGFFGYIDSFVTLYRIREGDLERMEALNVSSFGVITPKAMAWTERDGQTELCITGFGGPNAALIRGWPQGPASVQAFPLPPGTTDLAPQGTAWVAANPLLDAWVRFEGSGYEVIPVPDDGPRHGEEARLGELLFFTWLMAPTNSSAGAHSRFTCETCHFEGNGDGRVHYTGRGRVHASTKTLRGLFNNRPHFSRALDEDLTEMVNAEFRVAGSGSGDDPWFTLDPTDQEWLSNHVGGALRDPVALRRALMEWLMMFTHDPNPNRARLDSRGAVGGLPGQPEFAELCSACHAPRLVADDPATAVPERDWPRLVLSDEGPMVWGSDGYRLTGIEPTVHGEGARTPSLRRIAFKRPYFTNGSASDLEELLAMARMVDGVFRHHAPDGTGAPLTPQQQRALLAFLLLL